MALTKPTPQTNPGTPATDAANAVKSAGSFESMDETTSGKPAANDPAPQPEAAQVGLTPPAGALRLNKAEASAFQKEVEGMKGGADFAYGNYEVFKGINGEIKGIGDSKTSLGRWAKVSMIAWDDRVQISPGVDTDLAKDAVAYSKDGVTIDSVIGFERHGAWVGKPLSVYLEYLKESHDFVKARASRFIDVACVVHDCESDSGKELVGEVICVSLSSSSIPSFSQYQEKLNMKAKAVARGIPGVVVPADPFTFYFIREAASKDGKDWTKLKVSDKLKL